MSEWACVACCALICAASIFGCAVEWRKWSARVAIAKLRNTRQSQRFDPNCPRCGRHDFGPCGVCPSCDPDGYARIASGG